MIVKTNWVYTLIRAIDGLGGEAHVSALEQSPFVREEQNFQKDLAASIRGSIHDYCSDHASGRDKGARNGNARDVFEKIMPATWKIRDRSNPFVQFALREINSEQVKSQLREAGEIESHVEKLLNEMENDKGVHVREHWRSAPRTTLSSEQAFTIAHADDGKFLSVDPEAISEIRDLGIENATEGRFAAQVIRTNPGRDASKAWFSHKFAFHMIYVTQGWVQFEYDEAGAHVLRAGSSVLQPSGIRRREICRSDDLEYVEIKSLENFTTSFENVPK